MKLPQSLPPLRGLLAASLVFCAAAPLPASPGLSAHQPVPPPAVASTSAAPATTGTVLRLTGDLLPRVTVKIYARVAGLVTHVHFHEGTLFRAGDVMAELDPVEYELALQQASAALESATARVEAMEAGGRPEERARAAAEVDSAGAVHRNAVKNLERLQGLLVKGGISKQSVDDVSREVEVALSRLTAARKGLALVQEGPRPEEKRAARAEVSRQKAEVAMAKLRLAYTKVRAPFTGIAGQRLVDEGAYLLAASSPQAPAVAVLSQSHILRALVDLPERDLFRVRLGQPARVRVAAFPAEAFPATVINLFPYVDRATRMAKLELEVPNAPPRLLPGMFVEAEVPAAAQNARTTREVLNGRKPGQSEVGSTPTTVLTGSEDVAATRLPDAFPRATPESGRDLPRPAAGEAGGAR